VGGFVAALMLATATVMASASIGGRSPETEFSDPKLATLANAACAGDLGAIDKSLKNGVDPNGTGREGDTPLFWALKCENLKGIEALLKAGADPNYQIPGNFSATYAAATMSNPLPLKLILAHGGDPNASRADAPEKTALSEALELGIFHQGWSNYYALLDAGANINQADNVGHTVATQAAALRAYDKIVELLHRGYDYDLVSLGGAVQIAKVDYASSPEVAAAQAQVIEILREKGVQFPVPPLLLLYSGRVRMEKDGTLVVVWYGGYSGDGSSKIKASQQIIAPGDSAYDGMLQRVGGLKPLYGKGIPRKDGDPVPFFARHK
jgi:hypothetical protein